MALPGFFFGCTGCGSGVPEPVNIPGTGGGAAGINGQNAYTVLAAALTIPAIGANVTATVPNAYFMAFGQDIAIGSSTIGMAHFKVAVNVTSSTSVVLTFVGYPGDRPPGDVLPIGSVVSPTGPWGLPAPLAVYALSVTGPFITATPSIAIIGATPVTLVITIPGTYLLRSRAMVDCTSSTFAAPQMVSLGLKRTNNTAAYITHAESGLKLPIMTLAEYTAGIVQLPEVSYTTTNSDDSISLYVDVAVLPSAGTVRLIQAEIIAQRIY